MAPYCYILANRKHGTTYVGVTTDMPRRMEEHRLGVGSKFAARYGISTLVWYEEFDLVVDAIAREKAVKSWPRRWKNELIETMNPEWESLATHLFDM